MKKFSKMILVFLMAFTFIFTVDALSDDYDASIGNVDLGSAHVGYNQDLYEANPVVTNNGTVNLQISGGYSRIELTGGNTTSFEYGWNSGGGAIEPGQTTDKAWIKPVNGLGVGTYSATYAYQYYDDVGESWETLDTGTITFEVLEAGTTHNVSFNTHGGSSVDTQVINDGDHATEPTEDPTRDGYTFNGWYVDDTYAVEFDFDNIDITGDTVIHAGWLTNIDSANAIVASPIEDGNPSFNAIVTDSGYTASVECWYDDANPSYLLTAQSEFVAGHTYTVRVVFTASEGYTFVNGTTFTINGLSSDSYGGVGLRQKSMEVEAPEPSYQVTHNLNGGTLNGFDIYGHYSVGVVLTVNEANFITALDGEHDVQPPTGKVFDGVMVNDTKYNVGDDFELSGPTTFVYQWVTPVVVSTTTNNVGFDHAGKNTGTETKDYGFNVSNYITGKYADWNNALAAFEAEHDEEIVNIDAHDGIFTENTYGIIDEIEYTDVSYSGFDTIKTYVVHYTLMTVNLNVTVTFNSHGGTNIAPQTFLQGGTATEPNPAPSNGLKSFDGWFVDDTYSAEFDFSTPVNSNIELHAGWSDATTTSHLDLVKTEDDSEVLPYDADIEGYIESKRQEDAANQSTNPFGQAWLNLFVSTGGVYQYPVWTGTYFTGVTYPDDPGCSGVSCNGTAQYNYEARYTLVTVTKSDKVNVKFYAIPGEDPTVVEVTHGTTVDMPAQPVRNGYAFQGWTIDEARFNENTGEEDTTVAFYDFSTEVEAETVLVGSWLKIYTVDFDMGVMGFPQELSYVGQQVLAGNALEQPQDSNGDFTDYWNDYYLEGFYLDDTYNVAYNGEPITEDTTIYVRFNDAYLDADYSVDLVDLSVENPLVGTVITLTDPMDGDTQSPQLEVTVNNGDLYRLWTDDDIENYAYWHVDEECEGDLFAGELEKDGTYYAIIYLKVKDSLTTVFARDVVVKINGEEVAAEKINNSMQVLLVRVAITPDLYKILEGADQEMNENNLSDLVVRASGDDTTVVEVRVDNNVVTAPDAVVTHGSTVVTLSKGYLAGLNPGTHTLTIVYPDGDVSTTFTITGNPKTIDNIYMWITLLIASFGGLTFGLLKYRKEYSR